MSKSLVLTQIKGISETQTAEKTMSAMKPNAEIVKLKKRQLYHGETARNLHGRGKEHYYVLNNKSEKSSMYKHVLKEHKGNTDGIVFDWEVLGNFQKPLSRQIAEAIKMDNK